MKKIILSFFFLFQLSAFSQPDIQWQKCLGGSGHDETYSIQQTMEGGYIVAGGSLSNDGQVTGNHGGSSFSDYWIVKLTAFGSIQWQKCLGGTGDDIAFFIHQTSDGGYIVAGRSSSNDGNVSGNHGGYGDCWVIKLTSSGAIQWQKCFGGTGSDDAYSIRQTTDGGYIMSGGTSSNDGDVSGNHGGTYDCWIIKLNSIGVIQWQKCLGGTRADEPSLIEQTSDGGYILVGSSSSKDGDVSGNHGDDDYWIVKFTNSGTIQWQKCLGGSNSDAAYSIQQTTDGGYIVSGYTMSNDSDVSGNHGGYTDYWIVKLNGSGAIQWQKCLGGSGGEGSFSIRQTIDGGYIVAGSTSSNDGDVSGNHGGIDAWIVKLTDSGNVQWQKCLGGTGYDVGTFVQQTRDEGYIVAGYSTSNDNDVSGNHGGRDYWIVKLSSSGEIGLEQNELTIYPNPLTSSSTLEFSAPLNDASVIIYDMLGHEMMKKTMNGDRMEIERGSLVSGVYFVKVRSEEREWVEKIVVQ